MSREKKSKGNEDIESRNIAIDIGEREREKERERKREREAVHLLSTKKI